MMSGTCNTRGSTFYGKIERDEVKGVEKTE